MIRHPRDKPLRLRNVTCVYCAKEFGGDVERTKEHVIGRKFVPHVSFQDQWNLIVWACKDCNARKSDLEDDLAAITMQPDVFGRHAADDERLVRAAERKGKGSRSRRAGKPVGESQERTTIAGQFGPSASISFGFIAPPQAGWQRPVQLAELHLRAFFYLMTYDRNDRRGGLGSVYYAPVSVACRQDWGNARMRWFQDRVSDWPRRLHAVGADGFFKVAVRRCMPAELWAWALEWNLNMRLVGFLGEHEAVQSEVEAMPPLGSGRGYRVEEPLPEDEDQLFAPPDD